MLSDGPAYVRGLVFLSCSFQYMFFLPYIYCFYYPMIWGVPSLVLSVWCSVWLLHLGISFLRLRDFLLQFSMPLPEFLLLCRWFICLVFLWSPRISACSICEFLILTFSLIEWSSFSPIWSIPLVRLFVELFLWLPEIFFSGSSSVWFPWEVLFLYWILFLDLE